MTGALLHLARAVSSLALEVQALAKEIRESRIAADARAGRFPRDFPGWHPTPKAKSKHPRIGGDGPLDDAG